MSTNAGRRIVRPRRPSPSSPPRTCSRSPTATASTRAAASRRTHRVRLRLGVHEWQRLPVRRPRREPDHHRPPAGAAVAWPTASASTRRTASGTGRGANVRAKLVVPATSDCAASPDIINGITTDTANGLQSYPTGTTYTGTLSTTSNYTRRLARLRHQEGAGHRRPDVERPVLRPGPAVGHLAGLRGQRPHRQQRRPSSPWSTARTATAPRTTSVLDLSATASPTGTCSPTSSAWPAPAGTPTVVREPAARRGGLHAPGAAHRDEHQHHRAARRLRASRRRDQAHGGDAGARGARAGRREALETITQQLRSQVCPSTSIASLAAASANSVTFYADLSNGAAAVKDRVQKRVLTYDPVARTITQSVYLPTGVGTATTPPGPTFPATRAPRACLPPTWIPTASRSSATSRMRPAPRRRRRRRRPRPRRRSSSPH